MIFITYMCSFRVEAHVHSNKCPFLASLVCTLRVLRTPLLGKFIEVCCVLE